MGAYIYLPYLSSFSTRRLSRWYRQDHTHARTYIYTDVIDDIC